MNEEQATDGRQAAGARQAGRQPADVRRAVDGQPAGAQQVVERGESAAAGEREGRAAAAQRESLGTTCVQGGYRPGDGEPH